MRADRQMHADKPATHESAGISPERAAEAAGIIDRVTRWAARRPDVVGLLLVGSYARDAARRSSDVDLVLLTTDETPYAEDTWCQALGIGHPTRTQRGARSPNGASAPHPVSTSRSTSVRPAGPASTRSTLALAGSSPTAPVPCTTPRGRSTS
jgi:hypothetical protein